MPSACAVAAASSWTWLLVAELSAGLQGWVGPVWSRCGYPSGDHAWELLPNAAALFCKTCWLFWFLIKSHIYKLARTLSRRQRRVRLTRRLKIGPNCSPVEANLCFISSDKTSQGFPVHSLQIHHKPNHLGLPSKKSPHPSFPPASLGSCSRPRRCRGSRGVLSVTLLSKVHQLWRAAGALSPDGTCSVCYRLLGGAEGPCIYLLEVLYKSIPCF